MTNKQNMLKLHKTMNKDVSEYATMHKKLQTIERGRLPGYIAHQLG